jgi:hypothetical protein
MQVPDRRSQTAATETLTSREMQKSHDKSCRDSRMNEIEPSYFFPARV